MIQLTKFKIQDRKLTIVETHEGYTSSVELTENAILISIPTPQVGTFLKAVEWIKTHIDVYTSLNLDKLRFINALTNAINSILSREDLKCLHSI